ncbi:MAG: surfeit locus 1 family protein [Paracoccaceae bacterium]
MRVYIIPLIIGMGGVIVLLSLGIWQVQRLNWKISVLTEIKNKVSANPSVLPQKPSVDVDQYKSVRLKGTLLAEEVHVLISLKHIGPGYRLISAFELGDRRILIDQGFMSLDAKAKQRKKREVDVVGSLYWPAEVDRFTPNPDYKKNIWFARDVSELAKALGTEPVLIVASKITPEPRDVVSLPINTKRIPNNHLQYAITWFSLALVWATMTGYLVLGIKRQSTG